MQTSKSGSQNIGSNHSEWHLLAEYVLSEIMPDSGKGDELTAEFLSQPFQSLGVSPDWIRKVEMALTRLAKLALVSVKQEKLARSGTIRVFCQKKMIDGTNSVKTSSIYNNEEQAVEHVSIKYHSSMVMNGGWGYFIIERSGDDAGSPESSSPLVDLYLYQEGE